MLYQIWQTRNAVSRGGQARQCPQQLARRMEKILKPAEIPIEVSNAGKW
jgi:hypothetical protein